MVDQEMEAAYLYLDGRTSRQLASRMHREPDAAPISTAPPAAGHCTILWRRANLGASNGNDGC